MDPEVIIPAPLAGDGGDGVDSQEGADEEPEPPNIQEELDKFRNEWRKELTKKGSGANANDEQLPAEMQSEATLEEKASYWFMQGVNAEQSGKLYDAITYYRKAVQLVPDIEFRLADFQQVKKKRRARQESESSIESVGVTEEEDEEDEDDLDNLVGRFQRLTASDYTICHAGSEQNYCHFGQLPIEVMAYILKWVVSNELDIVSLENVAMVCRGFYLCSRDEELWRLICQKIWDMNVSRPRAYGTWRNMYLERPHLRFNGCYISKMSYYRHGERGMDNFYKPFMMVEYYRYVRFFPGGHMLMFTSPEDPYAALPRLRSRDSRSQGLLKGYYRMAGNQVTAVLKRVKPEHSNYYRYKRQQRQQQNQNDTEQTFHVEFDVIKRGKRIYSQLNWTRYAIHTRYSASDQESIAEFELKNDTYPPMIFSRVKSYTAWSESPLQ